MCLIIFTSNLARARIRRGVLEKAFYQNYDGVGIAYIDDGVLKVSKGHDIFDEFYADYRQTRTKVGSGACLIHFRAKSVGAVNAANIQPVVIHAGKLVMAHNGTIDSLKGDEESDSVRLGANIRRLGWEFPFTKPQVEILTMLCAGRSKLVFFDSTGKHQIVNANLGKWSRGAWYSDGGDILEPDVKPSSSSWSNYSPASYPPRGSAPSMPSIHGGYSTYGGDAADADLLPGPDDDVGFAEPKPLPTKRPLPLIKERTGPGIRANMMVGPQQRADILMAKLKVKRFTEINPTDLNGVDWREWQDVHRLLVS